MNPYSHAILGGIPGIPHFQTLTWCCVVSSPETTAKVSHAHELYNFFRAELANQYHEEMEASISMTLLVGCLKVGDTDDILLHLHPFTIIHLCGGCVICNMVDN